MPTPARRLPAERRTSKRFLLARRATGRQRLAGPTVALIFERGGSDNQCMPGTSDFDPTEIEATLRELEGLLVDPHNAVRVLYTRDAILMNGGVPVRGHEELLAREGVVPLCDAVIRPESIVGEDGLASVFGHFTCEIPVPDGGRVGVACHFMLVLRKENDGVWRVARECLVEDETAE